MRKEDYKLIDIREKKYEEIIDEVNVALYHLINDMEDGEKLCGDVKLLLSVSMEQYENGGTVQKLDWNACWKPWGGQWDIVRHPSGKPMIIE